MFVNFSNHPSVGWDEQQKLAAMQWGAIIDVPFPAVNPEADEKEILSMARTAVSSILSFKPDVVMCQGEFTLCFTVINLLRKQGIETVAACTKRTVKEIPKSDGTSIKESVFRFERFRKYK